MALLLGAAAFSWGCAGFVAGQNTGNPPPPTYTISGTISPSAGGNGATVTLSGAGSATTTANSSGAYTFMGLANGSYAVTPSHTGYTFSPTSQNATVNGANVSGINFTATASPTFSISGSITASGSALGGASVALTGPAAANTTTNSSGNYTFTGLANGTYTVTPSNSGYTFSPANQSVTINGANQTGVNFTATVTQSHTVALSWIASTTPTVVSYNVYRSTGNCNSLVKINPSPITTLAYTDATVANTTTYCYAATAVDSNSLESGFSTTATAVIP